MENSTQHFSLDSFLRNAINFYLQLWRVIKNGIRIYWKYSLALLFIIGMFFFFKARKTKTYFEANSSYVKNFLPNKVYGDKLFNLEKMLKNGDYESLSNSLKISSSLAKTFISFEAKNITGSPLHEDFTEMNVPFYIHTKLNNTDSIQVIQQAITKFMQSGEFVKNYISEEKLKLTKELDYINNEILILDSLKRHFDKNESSELSVLVSLTTEKWSRKLEIEKKIKLNNSVTLLNGFEAIKHSKNKKLKALGIKTGLLWLFLSLVITTFLSWYNNPSNEF